MTPRLPDRLGGMVLVLVGLVVGLVGAYMAYDARIHNAIVANTVENPWPGYLMATAGVVLFGVGVVAVRRSLSR